MKEYGGYFELELYGKDHFHKNALMLNTARNCFEYILRAKHIKKIYIPHYTCEVILEPIKKLGIEYKYYNINVDLEPIDIDTNENDYAFLYTNYFGIKQSFILKISEKINNLIIDNSMAFFCPQVRNKDTFYSARKFFGVSDGAYLYTDKFLSAEDIKQDISYNRMIQMLKRIELGANAAYKEFLENDYSLYNQPIKKMSKITEKILGSINYEYVKITRERNFLFLHEKLQQFNELKIDLYNLSGPMFYPFLYRDQELRKKLIENKIYVPTLWRNSLETSDSEDTEQYITNYLFALPIDQRYSLSDMNFILDKINI